MVWKFVVIPSPHYPPRDDLTNNCEYMNKKEMAKKRTSLARKDSTLYPHGPARTQSNTVILSVKVQISILEHTQNYSMGYRSQLTSSLTRALPNQPNQSYWAPNMYRTLPVWRSARAATTTTELLRQSALFLPLLYFQVFRLL